MPYPLLDTLHTFHLNLSFFQYKLFLYTKIFNRFNVKILIEGDNSHKCQQMSR